MSGRMGAIVLFLFVLNIGFGMSLKLGYTTGGVAAYYSLDAMGAKYSPDTVSGQITGIATVDNTLYGVALVTESLFFVHGVVYTMVGPGCYTFYHSLFSLVGQGDVEDDPGICALAIIFSVVQSLIVAIGLVEFLSGRKSGF